MDQLSEAFEWSVHAEWEDYGGEGPAQEDVHRESEQMAWAMADYWNGQRAAGKPGPRCTVLRRKVTTIRGPWQTVEHPAVDSVDKEAHT